MIRSIIVVGYLALYILILGPPFILHALLTGSVELLYRIGVNGARTALWMAGVRVRVEGLEHIPAGVCVFVANHASNADPPAVVGAIPRRVALLAKREVFRVPILSRALLLASFVPVDRTNREAAIQSVDEAIGHLRKGISYLVFPEGTRSHDGRLRQFKKGTFVMAIRAGVPVVPIAVIGSQRIMKKGSSALYPGEVVVRFLPAVATRGNADERKDELMRQVQATISDALPEDQKPLA